MSPMRILVVPLHVTAHLMELVPLCWAARAAGHEVLVAGAPDLTGTALRAGLGIVPIGDPVNMIEAGQGHLPPEWFPAGALERRDTPEGRFLWEQCAVAFLDQAQRHADDYLELVAQWQPDLLLVDSMSLLGWLVGSAAGLPVAHFHCGVTPLLGPFEDKARELLAPLARRLGVTELPRRDLVIDPCPPSLQAPDSPPGVPMRYVPYNGSGVQPEWARVKPDRRRICVSFGSVLAWTGPSAFHNVLAALADVDAEIVVTLSKSNRAVVGELPAGVRVVESLPLNLFLRTCDLIVHHGGTGTGLSATALGVPQLCLPQWGNSFDYATRLEAAGAGRSLPTRETQEVESIRAAITDLLDDPRYPKAAAALSAEMAAAPAPPALVTDLARLVTG